MYLKGYKIRYNGDTALTFPKWDFGGDKSHTNRVWNGLLAELRALPQNAYPMQILDLDKGINDCVNINNQEEFEYWLENDFHEK